MPSPILVANIDAAKALEAFPLIFALYGEKDLRNQIAAFNAAVSENDIPVSLIHELFSLRTKPFRGQIEAPRAILNGLSALCSPNLSLSPLLTTLGWVRLLENRLARLKILGINVKAYSSMLRDGRHFLQLLAEVDVVAQVAELGGDLAIHVPHGSGDFDFRWTAKGTRLSADVKWFQTELTQSRGYDLLEAQLSLLETDISHRIVITAANDEYSVASAIAASQETLALYQAALCGQNTDTARVSRSGQVVAATSKKRKALVRAVHVRIDGQGQEPLLRHVRLLAPMLHPDRDLETAQRNLERADTQLPRSETSHHASCAILRSALPASMAAVRKVLSAAGKSSKLRSAPAGTNTLSNVDTVIASTLNVTASSEDHSVAVNRSAQLLLAPARPNKSLNTALLRLAKALNASEVIVSTQNG